MPGILYLAAVLRQSQGRAWAGEVDCRYLNRSVQSFDSMVDALLQGEPDLIGLSCYSWNTRESLKLVAACKKQAPDTKVMLGGPGVHFNDPVDSIKLLEESSAVDAVVVGEGEGVISKVASVLLGGGSPAPVENAAVRLEEGFVCGPRVEEPIDVSLLPVIDPTDVDIPRSPGTGLSIVYQTYRGCPFRCSYCGFPGSLKGIRRFPIERIERELKHIFEERVDLVNFADSVFDLNLERAKSLLKICVEHNEETSLQCYAAFQRMDDELANLFERTGIQVGVGLQSVKEGVLRKVGRHSFSVERFRESIRVIGGRKVNYYVDLMFGLPRDDMSGFRATVNEVMALRAPFLMPFPLTVIPSSDIAIDPSEFGVTRYGDRELEEEVRPVSGMVYADIGLFRAFDITDLRRFDDVATAVFFAFQRYPRTVRRLADHAGDTAARGHGLDAFTIFERIGLNIRNRVGTESVDVSSPPAMERTLRQALTELSAEIAATDREVDRIAGLMRLDAAVAGMIERTDRRSAHRVVEERRARRLVPCVPDEPSDETVAFGAGNRLLRLPVVCADIDDLVVLQERIRGEEILLVATAPYGSWRTEVVELSPDEWKVCEEMTPFPREIRLSSLARRMLRSMDDLSWRRAVERLVSCNVLEIYFPNDRERKTLRD